jgi:anaphase-promoting complex subunit 5
MSHLAEALRESIPYLKIAMEDYTALQIYCALQDVLFLLSVVYHNLGMVAERDDVARLHHEVGKEREEAEKQVSEPWVAEVLDIVSEISLALAAR